ncbi:hypothetical protein ACS0TY_011532 [Phlomoides rotata]
MAYSFPEEVLEHVFLFLSSDRDRNAVSLVCKSWYQIERWCRHRIFVGNCYAVSPEIVIQRFPELRLVEIKGKPHFADFNLVPEGWGGHIYPWIVAMSEAYPFLEEIKLKRMVVTDESLELISKSFKNFKALVLSSCEGFTTDGLASIAANCRNLKELDLRESEVEDLSGHWLSHFPCNSTSLVSLNISCLGSEVSFSALERLVARSPNLRTLRLNRAVPLEKLPNLLRRAPQLVELGTGAYSAEIRSDIYSNLAEAFSACKHFPCFSVLILLKRLYKKKTPPSPSKVSENIDIKSIEQCTRLGSEDVKTSPTCTHHTTKAVESEFKIAEFFSRAKKSIFPKRQPLPKSRHIIIVDEDVGDTKVYDFKSEATRYPRRQNRKKIPARYVQTPENVVHIDANPNCSSRRLENENLNTGNSPLPSQQYTDHCNTVSIEDYALSPNADARGKDVECPNIPRITYVNLEDDTDEDRKLKRNRKLSPTAKSPYTNPNNHIGKRLRKVKFDVSQSPKSDTKFGGYNPFEFLPSADEKNLMGWLNKKKKNNAKIKIPLKYLQKVNAQWFDPILSSRGLLSQENIDVLMQMILLKVCKSPGQWLHHWTMVDYVFWDTLRRMYPSWADAKSKNLKWDWNTKSITIMKYVNGDLPHERSNMPWSFMDKVYGIAHVNTNHWVLYQTEPCRGRMIVYDSMSRKEKDW